MIRLCISFSRTVRRLHNTKPIFTATATVRRSPESDLKALDEAIYEPKAEGELEKPKAAPRPAGRTVQAEPSQTGAPVADRKKESAQIIGRHMPIRPEEGTGWSGATKWRW